MTRPRRVLLAAVLVGLVFGMGVHYDSAEAGQWPYPDTDRLAAEYDQYVGEQALLFGTVESVSEGTTRLSVEYTTGSFSLTVREFDADVEPGGVVQVVGRLEPGRAMTPEAVAVVNPSGSSLVYKYGTSLVGAALVLVVFFRYWRVDWGSLSLEVREDG
ncbi:MAG: hypothetical protein ACI9HI_002043 [Salinirussus sp.]